MLNHSKTLILGLRFSHYFPYHEHMVHFERMSLISCDIRYMLLNNRLTLSASVSDPFGWNITKSTALYNDYSVYTRNNIHSHAVSFRIAYNFGRNKVNGVYRDNKERAVATFLAYRGLFRAVFHNFANDYRERI